METCNVVQAILKLLGQISLPASVFHTGATGMCPRVHLKSWILSHVLPLQPCILNILRVALASYIESLDRRKYYQLLLFEIGQCFLMGSEQNCCLWGDHLTCLLSFLPFLLCWSQGGALNEWATIRVHSCRLGVVPQNTFLTVYLHMTSDILLRPTQLSLPFSPHP